MKQAVSRERPRGEDRDAQVSKGIYRRQYSIYMETSREERVKGFSPLPHQPAR
jgi:hypothetical protein